MRKLTLIMSVMLLIAMISACAANSGTGTASPPPVTDDTQEGLDSTPAGDNTEDASDEASGNRPDSSPGSLRRDFSQADTQGVVTRVVGNEVTLKLIEPVNAGTIFTGSPSGLGSFSGIAPGNRPDGEERSFEGFNPDNLPDGIDISEGGIRIDPDSLPEGITLPEGFDSGNMPQRGQNRDSSARSGGGMLRASAAELEVTYTGDEITVTIPVGVSTTAFSKKQVLMLWTDEAGEVTNVMVAGTAAN